MEQNKQDLNNFAQNEADLNKEPFFKENPIKNISKKENRAVLRTQSILDYIKKNPYCTPYEISKVLEINYATTSQTIKELIFCNAIAFKIEIGENNRTHKKVFVPELKGDDDHENS